MGTSHERLPRFVEDMNDYQVSAFLQGVVQLAREFAARNYRLAVPQFFGGRLQLLLPLCFSDPRKADLALVVERCECFYQAATALTLEMAYNNARLVSRPEQPWLQPTGPVIPVET